MNAFLERLSEVAKSRIENSEVGTEAFLNSEKTRVLVDHELGKLGEYLYERYITHIESEGEIP